MSDKKASRLNGISIKGIVIPEYEEWVDVLTNYYEVDLDNCKMNNEAWIEQLALCLTYPKSFIRDVIEYREVEGRDLNSSTLLNNFKNKL